MPDPFFVQTEPMTAERRQWLDAKAEVTIQEDRRIEGLQQRLLALGGEAGVFVPNSPWFDALLSRGIAFPGDSRLRRGGSGQCHYNAARLWSEARDRRQLVTGYALSEDGCWRRHSWILDPSKGKPPIVETTIKRLLYFGVVLATEEADQFWRAEVGPTLENEPPIFNPKSPDEIFVPFVFQSKINPQSRIQNFPCPNQPSTT